MEFDGNRKRGMAEIPYIRSCKEAGMIACFFFAVHFFVW